MIRYPRTVLATCCVPWDDKDQFMEGLFREGVRRLIADGLSDLYIFGTAGEGHAVSERLYREIATVFCEETLAAGAAPMVGAMGLSVPEICHRIEFAADLGCRTFQISLPSWGPLNDTELARFFQALCGGYPELEFVHYNIARTGRLVLPGEYARLAERHPNLVATKYGAGHPEMVAGLLTQAPMLRHFLTELGFFLGAPLGEPGLLASIASGNPARARAYYAAATTGDLPTLTALYTELASMMVSLRTAVGPGPHQDGAFDKVIAKVADPRFPLRLLAPYETATDAAYAQYAAALRTRFPDWLPDPREGDTDEVGHRDQA